MTLSRRDWLRHAVVALPLLRQSPQQPAVRTDTGAVRADPLLDPELTGRMADSTTRWDNDPTIVAIEHKLRCRCGCTLDVFTCRTTDFTCTYSPEMHREVVSLIVGGKTPQQVLDTFVSTDGIQVLMAPPPSGFNLAGYLVPGLGVLSVGLVLIAWLSRRRGEVATVPVAVSLPVTPVAEPSDAQRERLQRALDEVES